MAKVGSKTSQRKNKQVLRSTLPFMIVIIAITGLIAYLWIYSEVDETLKELESQQAKLIEINDDISNLKDDIEYLQRVDVLTARAKNDLGMVFTVPETIAIYIDNTNFDNSK